MDQFSRTRMLLGNTAMEQLNNTKVAVFGIGGVGGFVVEGLARAGVGSFVLIDNDTVCLSNVNRQIIATHKTLGKYKTEVMKERILDINPQAQVEMHQCFYLPETADAFDFQEYNYIVDAIDTVTGKLEIIVRAKEACVPVISCMGTGNKLHPELLAITDIYKTSMCPLAKVMRKELKRRHISKLKVLYSTEQALTPLPSEEEEPAKRRSTPGSVSFVPSVAGLMIAGEVVRDLINREM